MSKKPKLQKVARKKSTAKPAFVAEMIDAAEDGDYFSIYQLLEERGLAAARHAFKTAFGVTHTDKSFEAEVEMCFRNAVAGERPGSKVELRAQAVLAVMLREGFNRQRGKTGRRPLTKFKAIKEYKLLRGSMSNEEAAKQIADRYPFSVEQILDGHIHRYRKPGGRKAPNTGR